MSMPEQPQRPEELQSSVAIEDSAKGPRIAVKVYNLDPDEASREACRVYGDTLAWLEARGLRGGA